VKAWQKQNGVLTLADVPEPKPAADQLVVQVRAISLNRGEVRAVARAAEGAVPGWDVAGTVLEPAQLGASPSKGTRVVAMLDGGGWAERVAIPVARVGVIPDGVGFDVAATLPIAALTAVRAIALAAPVKGSRILVTGGSGGVGQFAVQLAALENAEVTAVSSRAAQHAVLKSLGARDVVARIDDARGPFDLVLESVGGPSLAKAIELVGSEGIVVTFGNSSEQETCFIARTLFGKGAATLYGLLVFEEYDSGRIGARDLERLMALVRDGKLHSPISLRRPWTELPATIRELDKREYPGKAVLEVPAGP
jgi:NADPH:quinone reductase-like Zn-dependent oxidoreductase